MITIALAVTGCANKNEPKQVEKVDNAAAGTAERPSALSYARSPRR